MLFLVTACPQTKVVEKPVTCEAIYIPFPKYPKLTWESCGEGCFFLDKGELADWIIWRDGVVRWHINVKSICAWE